MKDYHYLGKAEVGIKSGDASQWYNSPWKRSSNISTQKSIWEDVIQKKLFFFKKEKNLKQPKVFLIHQWQKKGHH